MTAVSRIRGWCPSLYEPMRSGDGLLLRVKPRAATLSADQANAVALAAACHGNGGIELTNRANLQIRGLTDAGVEPFTRAMLEAGLADADPGVERRRNLLVPPLLGEDPALPSALPALAEELHAVLADAALAPLPGKFGLLLEGGGLPAGEADIAIRLTPAGAELRLPGGDVLACCTPDATPEAARRLALAFMALAPQCPAPPRRMRALVQALGAGRVFAEAGLPARPDDQTPQGTDRPPIGFRAYAGGDRGAFGLGLPFGQISAAQLQALAGLAAAFGAGSLRTTPWRAVLLPGVATGRADALRVAAEAAGLIAHPTDPRLRVLTCVGQRGCASGSSDTRADAAALAPYVAAGGAGLLHLSGCAKGCAHPAAAPVTLVGQNGRYGLVLRGRAGDPPARSGLTLAEAAAALEER
jgi:precorrin-3B synthase